MSDTPQELKFTKSHEWLSQDNEIITIGISQHAQLLLGDVVFVELPEVGDVIHKGQEFGVIESVKAASDLYAPVSGEVVEVNEELEDSPSTVNISPFGDGWLIKIKDVEQPELDELLSADEYDQYVLEEA
jgi:glycine cleavage system H protein